MDDIREDSRSLRDFYVDASMRRQVHYDFAHKFLPEYVHQNPYGFLCSFFSKDTPEVAEFPTRFIQARWQMFERMAGLAPGLGHLESPMVFRRVADLSMSVREVAGRATGLIQMPRPEGPVEAFFVAVVLLAFSPTSETWSRDVQARVFTLEREVETSPDKEETGVLGEWTREGVHLNFGPGVAVQADAFLQSIAALLQGAEPSPAASFTSNNDDSLGGTTRLAVDRNEPPKLPIKPKKPWWKFW